MHGVAPRHDVLQTPSTAMVWVRQHVRDWQRRHALLDHSAVVMTTAISSMLFVDIEARDDRAAPPPDVPASDNEDDSTDEENGAGDIGVLCVHCRRIAHRFVHGSPTVCDCLSVRVCGSTDPHTGHRRDDHKSTRAHTRSNTRPSAVANLPLGSGCIVAPGSSLDALHHVSPHSAFHLMAMQRDLVALESMTTRSTPARPHTAAGGGGGDAAEGVSKEPALLLSLGLASSWVRAGAVIAFAKLVVEIPLVWPSANTRTAD